MKRNAITLSVLVVLSLLFIAPARAQSAYGIAPSFVASRTTGGANFFGFGGKLTTYDLLRRFGLLAEVNYTTKTEAQSLLGGGAITADYRRVDVLLGFAIGLGDEAAHTIWYAAPKAGLVRAELSGGTGFVSVSDKKYGPAFGLSIGTINRPLFFDVGAVFVPSQELIGADTQWMISGSLSLGFAF